MWATSSFSEMGGPSVEVTRVGEWADSKIKGVIIDYRTSRNRLSHFYIHTHMLSYIHTHSQNMFCYTTCVCITHSLIYTHILIHIHIFTYIHTYSHTWTQIIFLHTYFHRYTQILTHTQRCSYILTDSNTHTQILIHSHRCSHVNTGSHSLHKHRFHTYTHSHQQEYLNVCFQTKNYI